MRLPTWSVALYLIFDSARSLSPMLKQQHHQERLFRARSDQDWASVWHQESHVRCRENLARHLFWACEKDIYKISKRKGEQFQSISHLNIWPMIDVEDATSILRVRRSASGSITDECCSRQGCTWEEYAEYCPDHRRDRKMRPSE